jgi:hypothetical protein
MNTFSDHTFTGANPAEAGFINQFTTSDLPSQLASISGGSGGGNTSNITFASNTITGTAGGLNVAAQEQGNALVIIDANGATIRKNTFSGATSRFATLSVGAGSTIKLQPFGRARQVVVADAARFESAAPLMVLGVDGGDGSNPAGLTPARLGTRFDEAITSWRDAGVDEAGLAALRGTRVALADLSDGYLGLVTPGTITLDRIGGGHGRFVVRAPDRDEEFGALAGVTARGRMDMLSALVDEMGHILGQDQDEGVMGEVLRAGVRQVPSSGTESAPSLFENLAAPLGRRRRRR